MALVKCKECGKDVSAKAKICQQCGAKVPKKTSLSTWLVLIFIVFIVYAASQNPVSTGGSVSTKQSVSTSDSPTKTEVGKKVAPPKPSWKTSSSKDEMTGKLSAYAHSPIAIPTKKMSFPYGDVHGWLGIGCDSKNEWAYFGFNMAPNLTKDETKDGYNLIKTRVKWNDEVENVILTQEWGAKFIHFRNYSSAISKIAISNTALLELHWHGQQPTYFEFSLNGSSKALADIRAKCIKSK